MQTSLEKSPATSSDTELLGRFAASGDDPAFAELVRRYLPLVLAVTRRRLGNSGLAEDAAQQAFIALSRRVKTVRGIPCLAAWLQKAAVYEAANIARSESRHRKRAEQSRDIWNATSPSAPEQRLDEALAALPDADRQVLLLHHFEKLPFEEIATRLRVSPAAAQRRGHRALGKLGELLKKRGIERSEAACTIWLGASLSPRGVSFPADLVTRTVAMKKNATASMPWVPLITALMIGGALSTPFLIRSTPFTPSTIATATAPRAPVKKVRPQTPDDQLGEDFREFITRAKADSKDAWEWVKARPDGPGSFLAKAMRHLADRDLPAAERMLDVVESGIVRADVIGPIFRSRAEGNFEAAIVWIDSFPAADDRRVTIYHGGGDYFSFEPGEHDNLAALKIAHSPEVRRWLIQQVYQESRRSDESVIEKLAGELEGDERRIALCYVASLRLERNDPSGFELLDEIKPSDEEIIYFPSSFQIRDFQPMCEWIARQKDGASRQSIARSAWENWAERDAPGAAAWALEINRKGGINGMHLTPSDPVTKRLMTAP